MKNSAQGLLTTLDDLFSTQEEREVASQPRVQEISIDLIDEFPNHPFKVRMDESMMEMADSVKQHGILVPAIIRPKEDGRYEMVAGHRRMTACMIAEKEEIPCIVRDLTDEESTIIMVDSNLQREQLLPSEKAFAYKMKLDAMRRQAGRPGKENSVPPGHHLLEGKSREILAATSPDSNTQIQRYIRLTVLIPELLDLVDNSILKEKEKLQIALRPAVELSYLTQQEQRDLHETMLTEDCTPSHVQAMVYESLPAYFKVYAPNPTGSLSLTKTTEDGKNLSGWQFGIYTNSACMALAAGPFTTDSSGKISVTDLTAGTYYVKELGHTDSTINALYYCSSTNPQKVTITAGSTASVSFTNKLNTGSLALTKTTEDGKNLSGWQFGIYSNSSCTTLVSGPHTTNSTGKISVTGLKPGTYYVKEIGHTDSSINALYYCSSTNPQKITITANSTASVSFSNKLNTGDLSLTKTTEDSKNLEGWQFSIYSDSSCSTLVSGPHTTDSTGKISVTDLKPGTYYVKEIGHTDSTINALYTCASTNPQKVTITGNTTTNVNFQNKLNSGSAKLVKETSCGEHLSGWQIGLYTDAACTKAVPDSPFTIGEDGSVTVSDLSVGTLYAKEVPVDDPYWVCDPEIKTVTIEAGKTATVSFLNTHYGNIRITKNAVNGSAEGWNFQILDAERNAIGTVKSGADGFAYSDMLLPGQYFIREIHDRDDTYWEYDVVAEKEVTVTAGSQVEVSYTNTQYGKIQIQKSMSDGGSLDGWQFSITDTSGKEIEGSPFTTNASGLILTGKLQPGEYTVKEIIPEDSFYYCTSENPQTITVKAGETAQVSFTNAMRTGSITIEKVDPRGEPLAGAKFLLQWSEDGSLWWPIEYSETLGEGKCSNPNIEDGCLTSGKDGLLEWPNLHPGLYYRVTELEAPRGYTLLSKPAFEGKLPGEELNVSLRVVNCEIFTLPQTGSSSAAIFRISQLLCICVCFILLIHSYRRKDRK